MSGLSPEEQRRRLDAMLRAGIIDEARHKALVARIDQPSQAESGPSRPRAARPATARPRVDRSDLARAPYRFVTFPSDAVLRPEPAALGPLGVPKPDGCCAEIEIEWLAESPLLVGQERETDGKTLVAPVTLPQGGRQAWIIPGATLRGTIRSAAEIVGFARLTQVNRGHTFGLRDFEHDSYGESRYPVADPQQLRAGWIRRGAGSDPLAYELLPCPQWYVVPVEEMLRARVLRTRAQSARQFTTQKLWEKYSEAGMARHDAASDERRIDFRGEPRRFAPMAPINGKDALRPDSDGAIRGYFVFSGPSPSGKRLEYVFPPADESKAQSIKSDVWEQFERMHSETVKDRLKPSDSWDLFKRQLERVPGALVPVFYVGEVAAQRPDSFAMGLTRLFKVPHDYSLGEVLARSGATPPPLSFEERTGRKKVDPADTDMVANLFGYVYEAEDFGIDDREKSRDPGAFARRGRVSFSSARLVDPDGAALTRPIETVTMGARPSFAPFYLRGKYKDYSDPAATIAGRKSYLPRFPADRLGSAAGEVERRLAGQIEAVKAASGRDRVGEKVETRLQFLVPQPNRELRFRSVVRCFNVTPAELGLLLWAITHGGTRNDPEGRRRHMIGRAKPFGAGQLRVSVARLRVERNAAPGVAAVDPAEFIGAFETYAGKEIGAATFRAVIGEYLASRDPGVGAKLSKAGKLDYLPLRIEVDGRRLNPYQELRGMAKPRKDGSAPVGKDRLLGFE